VKCSQPYPGSLCSLVKPHPFLIISSYIQELSILMFLDSPADFGTCYSQGGLTQVVGKN